MTKREAAERNVKANHTYCGECPFDVECLGYCIEYSKQWLDDNPETDGWEEIDTDKYEIETINDYSKLGGGGTLFQKQTIKYRKKAPKHPTHEEIMTTGLFWDFTDQGRGWLMVVGYLYGKYIVHDPLDQDFINFPKHSFTNRDSADIPPEN